MLFVIPSMEPEQFLLNPSARPVLETSGETTERGGQPLLPHTDVSATRLRGGLDTTLQVSIKIKGGSCGGSHGAKEPYPGVMKAHRITMESRRHTMSIGAFLC
jgi:hypothetical protein